LSAISINVISNKKAKEKEIERREGRRKGLSAISITGRRKKKRAKEKEKNSKRGRGRRDEGEEERSGEKEDDHNSPQIIFTSSSSSPPLSFSLLFLFFAKLTPSLPSSIFFLS